MVPALFYSCLFLLSFGVRNFVTLAAPPPSISSPDIATAPVSSPSSRTPPPLSTIPPSSGQRPNSPRPPPAPSPSIINEPPPLHPPPLASPRSPAPPFNQPISSSPRSSPVSPPPSPATPTVTASPPPLLAPSPEPSKQFPPPPLPPPPSPNTVAPQPQPPSPDSPAPQPSPPQSPPPPSPPGTPSSAPSPSPSPSPSPGPGAGPSASPGPSSDSPSPSPSPASDIPPPPLEAPPPLAPSPQIAPNSTNLVTLMPLSFSSYAYGVFYTNQSTVTFSWVLQGDASTTVCLLEECNFFCHINGTAEVYAVPCGSGQLGGNASITYTSLSDATYSFTLTVVDNIMTYTNIQQITISVDTVPPLAVMSPLFSSTPVLFKGSQSEVYSWTNTSELHFSLCVDSVTRETVTSAVIAVSNGFLLSIVPNTLVDCPSLLPSNDSSSAATTYVQRYELIVQPASVDYGLLTVGLRQDSLHDIANNGNTNFSRQTANVLLIQTPPSPAVGSPDGVKPQTSSLNYTLLVSFGQPVYGFTPSGISVLNGTVTSVAEAPDSYGGIYAVDISLLQNTVATVTLLQGAATDYAGRPTPAGSPKSIVQYKETSSVAAVTHLSSVLVASLVATSVSVPLLVGKLGASSVHSSFAAFAAKSQPHSSHSLRMITQMQSLALLSGLSVTFPGNFQSCLDNVQWTLGNMATPFETAAFGNSSVESATSLNLSSNQTAYPPPPSVGRRRLLSSSNISDTRTTLAEIANSDYVGLASPEAFQATLLNFFDSQVQTSSLGLREVSRIVFWFSVLILICVILQFLLPRLLSLLKLSQLSFFAFPRLQIFLGTVMVQSAIFVAAVLLLGRSTWGYATSAVLIILTFAFVTYCIVLVLLNIVGLGRARFVVKDNQRARRAALIKVIIPNDYSDKSRWEAQDDDFIARYGILFESFKGFRFEVREKSMLPPIKTAVARQSSMEHPFGSSDSYQKLGYGVGASKIGVEEIQPAESSASSIYEGHGHVSVTSDDKYMRVWANQSRNSDVESNDGRVSETEPAPSNSALLTSFIGLFRQLYFSITLITLAGVAAITGAFNQNQTSLLQLWLILGFRIFILVCLLTLKPFISLGDYVVELISLLGDLVTAIITVVLVKVDPSSGTYSDLGIALLVFQLGVLLIKVGYFWFMLFKDTIIPAVAGWFGSESDETTGDSDSGAPSNVQNGRSLSSADWERALKY